MHMLSSQTDWFLISALFNDIFAKFMVHQRPFFCKEKFDILKQRKVGGALFWQLNLTMREVKTTYHVEELKKAVLVAFWRILCQSPAQVMFKCGLFGAPQTVLTMLHSVRKWLPNSLTQHIKALCGLRGALKRKQKAVTKARLSQQKWKQHLHQTFTSTFLHKMEF